MSNFAGQAIASGGFGCVFNPAIKCKGSLMRTDGVSKLMFNRDAIAEYKEISKIKPILEKIPDNDKYFILTGITICNPDKLDEEDLKNLDRICNVIRESGINSKNINSRLNEFKILNLPFGGEDLNIIIDNLKSVKELASINRKLIELLTNAIILMNSNGLFHNDIKDKNILYNVKTDEMRLIDWGLSGVSRKSKIIPTILFNRPFQFNIPFTIILFNTIFKQFYYDRLQKITYSDKPNITDLKNIVFEFINKYNLHNKGHGQFILNILPRVLLSSQLNDKSKIEDNKKYGSVMNILLDYIATALFYYSDFKKKIFLENKYFLEVYSKNVDIWGLTVINMEYILHANQKNFKNMMKAIPPENSKKFYIDVANLLYKYLFSKEFSARAINMDSLVNDLLNLNVLLGGEKTISRSVDKKIPPIKKEDIVLKGSKTKTLENIINKQMDVINLSQVNNNFDATQKTTVKPDIKNILDFSKERKTKKTNVKQETGIVGMTQKLKRCPNGFRRNPKTKECEPKNKEVSIKNISIKESKSKKSKSKKSKSSDGTPILEENKTNIETKTKTKTNTKTKKSIMNKILTKKIPILSVKESSRGTPILELNKTLTKTIPVKRCQKGYHRVPPKTGTCIPKGRKIEEIDVKLVMDETKRKTKAKTKLNDPILVSATKKLPRCKKGYRRVPPKTGDCIPKV